MANPFGGSDPPAALFHYSRDRGGTHPRGHLAEWSGILQADAYAGFNALYVKGRVPAPITEASCWAHGRRQVLRAGQSRQGHAGADGH